jgi:hypothetical protein
MDPGPEVTVEVKLTPNDIYTPFRWQRDKVIRWVVAALLCLIFATYMPLPPRPPSIPFRAAGQ